MKKKANLIGLTGTNGAGKGEAAAFFMENGFQYYSLSDIIREELSREGMACTRNNMIRKGNDMRKEYGPDILAQRILRQVKDRAVIDSIRNPLEIIHLRGRKDFVLLAVDAPAAVRFARVIDRGRDESALTLEEFMSKEQEEMGESREGQQLQRCIEMADKLIINDGTIESFRKKLEKFL